MTEDGLNKLVEGLALAFGVTALKTAVDALSGKPMDAVEATAAVDAAEEVKLAAVEAGTVADPTPEP